MDSNGGDEEEEGGREKEGASNGGTEDGKETPPSYIGRTFRKEFPPLGTFEGKVTNRNIRSGFWRVEYSDGDGEELDQDELLAALGEAPREQRRRSARLGSAGSLVAHQWSQTNAFIVHWKNASTIDGKFGSGAFDKLLSTLEWSKTDDRNLRARPEISDNPAVAWLAASAEAHQPWLRRHYVLTYAQLTVQRGGASLPAHKDKAHWAEV